jgi:leucyl aminopeptidase
MLPCFAEPSATALPLHAVTQAGLAEWTAGHEAGGFITASGFKARSGELLLLPGQDGLGGAVLGLGDGAPSAWSFGGAAHALPAGSVWRLEGAPDPARAVLGWGLGAYRYTRFKAPGRECARLVPPPGTEPAQREADAVWFARDLINHPANILGPRELAECVVALGAAHGATVRLTAGEELERAYPTVAAVGRGSARPPVVADLSWRGSTAAPDAKLVTLCGKGVCFDTGGYDLKPAASMLRMKKDMGGAAVALGVARLVMQADLPVRLRVLIGAVENSIGAHAMRPLDVVQTRKGLTVEIGNTDAEGRLVLCDLLAEADAEAPALLMDFATLTGAARVALGPDLVALFAQDDGLAASLLDAGTAVEDPVWRMPLWPGYAAWLESQAADLANVASKPHAGAIVAALFLQRFVSPNRCWAHFDLYAWNDSPRPGRPEGGEATGLRAAYHAIAARVGTPMRE